MLYQRGLATQRIICVLLIVELNEDDVANTNEGRSKIIILQNVSQRSSPKATL